MVSENWGFNDWSSSAFRDSNIVWSDCRDLVEVPGGSEWKIRRLVDSHPQYCWKYAGTSCIVQYQFDIANSEANKYVLQPADQGVGDFPLLPVFYAVLPHFVSPFEISLQPKYLYRARDNVIAQLNEFYENNTYVQFSTDTEIFESIACACKIGDSWLRGRIMKIHGNSNVIVDLVDFGTERVVDVASLRPLMLRFGRLPPLALKCRVKDVYVNDLDSHKVELFKQIIRSCGNLIRAELCTTTEPYFVNLFHPTVDGYNIGKVFYRPPEDANRELAKQRKWRDHVRRENDSDDSDFDDSDDYGEEEAQPQMFIRSFDRVPKICRFGGPPLHVSYIENSRMIYLHEHWMIRDLHIIECSISEMWDSMPDLPASWKAEGTACAICVENSYFRANICEVTHDLIYLHLVDHGQHIQLDVNAPLKAIPDSEVFAREPLVYVVALSGAFDVFPHPTSTRILRDILPNGSLVDFIVDRKHKRIPSQGSLSIDSVDISGYLSQMLTTMRTDVNCRSLTGYVPREDFEWQMDSNFRHRLFCTPQFLRGNLSIEPM